MTNITRPGVTDAWRANVATNQPNLLRFMGNGSKAIEGRDRDDMIAAAKKYIDSLLG
jgi:hypothetical protein